MIASDAVVKLRFRASGVLPVIAGLFAAAASCSLSARGVHTPEQAAAEVESPAPDVWRSPSC